MNENIEKTNIMKTINSKIFTSMCKFKSNYKREFIKRLLRMVQFRNFKFTNAKIKKSRYYLLFFSSVCRNIKLRDKLEEMYDSARNKNKEKIKKKAIKGLIEYTEYALSYRSYFYRKKLLQTLFFKNLKDNYVLSIQNFLFYRKLHLKKYFINRWKRTLLKMKNFNLSRLKFLSKFINAWKYEALELKEKRYMNITLMFEIFSNLLMKQSKRRKKDFIKKFQIYVLNLRLLEKNYEVARKFVFQKNLKKKFEIFRILYYNKQLSNFERRKHFRLKASILYVLRNYRIFKLTKKLNDNDKLYKIESLRKKTIYKKIKNLFKIIRESIIIKKLKADYFRNFIRKIRIFQMLKNDYLDQRSKKNELVKKFKLYYLKRKIFNLIIKNYIKKLRENSIICKLKAFYKTKRFKMLKSVVDNWKRFFIIQKFRKIKEFQKKVKIFYLLKFTCKSKRIKNDEDYFEGKI